MSNVCDECIIRLNNKQAKIIKKEKFEVIAKSHINISNRQHLTS